MKLLFANSTVCRAFTLAIFLGFLYSPARAQVGGVQFVHDPRIIESGGFFYLFSTGDGIPIRRSKDLFSWEMIGSVFNQVPAWVAKDYPGTRHLWAPDISYFANAYHVYYAISKFASNESRIGLVTNTTLNPHDQ